MCGASSQQNELSNEQAQSYKNLNDAYNTTFGQSQAITGALTKAFTPILAAGPNQQGFSQGEQDALQTGATENTGANYAAANRATSQNLAARGGGNAFIPSGVDAQLNATNANSAAASLSSQENSNTIQNYEQGRQNWQTAAGELNGTAGLLNPNAYAGSATGAGSLAMNSATTVNNANNSGWQLAAGALGSVAGAAAGNLNFSSGKGWSLGSSQ